MGNKQSQEKMVDVYWRGLLPAIACAVLGSSTIHAELKSSMLLSSQDRQSNLKSWHAPILDCHSVSKAGHCSAMLYALCYCQGVACAHCQSGITYLVCKRLPKLDFTAQFAKGPLLVQC